MKNFIRATVLLFSLMAAPVMAAGDPVYTSWRNNVAIGGYDSVSFFAGKPVEGKEEFTLEYNGADWRFSTQANLDLFRTNPTAFAPQYGGYCAYAVANGKLAKGSPKHWAVKDGKLYLNFNGRIQTIWDRDQDSFISDANAKWPDILED